MMKLLRTLVARAIHPRVIEYILVGAVIGGAVSDKEALMMRSGPVAE
jgi:hypothetical protein